MADVLNIARENGKKLLGVDRVRVKPFIAQYGASDYLVVVEKDDGCSKTSDCKR